MNGGRRLEGRDRVESYGRLREKSEELGQFGLHLVNVAAKVVENLLSGGGFVFRISLERCAERGEIREAPFFRDHRHFALDSVDFPKAELVDPLRSHLGGLAAVDVVLISLLAVWQRSNRKGGAAVGSIFRAKEGSESLVGGDDIGVNSGADLLR